MIKLSQQIEQVFASLSFEFDSFVVSFFLLKNLAIFHVSELNPANSETALKVIFFPLELLILAFGSFAAYFIVLTGKFGDIFLRLVLTLLYGLSFFMIYSMPCFESSLPQVLKYIRNQMNKYISLIFFNGHEQCKPSQKD